MYGYSTEKLTISQSVNFSRTNEVSEILLKTDHRRSKIIGVSKGLNTVSDRYGRKCTDRKESYRRTSLKGLKYSYGQEPNPGWD